MEDNSEDIHKITFKTNAKEASNDTNKLGASIEHTTNATNKNTNAVSQGNEAFRTFKTQLREANQELAKQIQLTGESSKETIKAAKAVAHLKDQMKFAQDLSANFDPDQKMKSLGAATRIAATGVQGVTAGMALFGDQSADTQKTLLKVQAAMAFSDAISGLSSLGDQWKLLKNTISASTISTKANAAATGVAAMVQNLFTGSVNTTSAGFKGLKLVIAGTGIGLLVVGLALVVTNFGKIKDVILNVVPGLASVGKFIGSIVNSVTDFIGVTSEAGRAVDRMKENAKASLALNEKFLAEHGSQLDEFTKQKMAAKDKYNVAIEKAGADQIALAKELNRELAKIEYSRGDESRKIEKENREKAEDEKKAAAKSKKDKDDADAQKIVDDKIAAEKKSAADAAAIIEELERKKETPAQKETREYEEKKSILEANFLSTEELTAQHLFNLSEIQKTADEKAAADKKVVDDKVVADQKIIDEAKLALQEHLETSRVKLIDSAIGFLFKIAGKNKALQRAAIIVESAVGIGRTLIANATGNATAAAVATPLLVNPITAVPAAAALTASTLNNNIATGLGVAGNVLATAKALQALGGGSAPSGGGISSGGARGFTPPAVAFNNTAENQIGQSVAKTQSEQPPIQVVVLENDITEAQNNVKVLVNKNTF